jgi:hypothetical protein
MYSRCTYCANELRAAPVPGPGTDAEEGGEEAPRSRCERNLAHQGSQATSFLGRMRATSTGSCDAGANGVEFRGALRLEEPGNSFTLITADTLLLELPTHFAVTSSSA